MEIVKKTNWVQLLSFILIGVLGTDVIILSIQNRELKATLSSMRVMTRLEPLRPGERVEAFTLQTLDGKVTELSYTDPARKYLLFVFSTTCPHCDNTLPAWSEIVAGNTNEHCDIIGVSMRPIEETREFAAGKRIPFYLASAAADTGFTRKYKIPGVPETILIDGDGTVEKTWAGELTTEQITEIQTLMSDTKRVMN